MGPRSWFRRFVVSKVKKLLDIYDKYDYFIDIAFFPDGSETSFEGNPVSSIARRQRTDVLAKDKTFGADRLPSYDGDSSPIIS
ncbi:hypothetical protein MKZ38_003101 [Zalerion maritima]|uniref:Uncharacterized protein n=1 Tax=Zalerion maritima TaxID=339359 RepID=A0AAD5RZ18_9PEZI|nr:hypothetical protein MKZ38_003101 [Zalerion maritima]